MIIYSNFDDLILIIIIYFNYDEINDERDGRTKKTKHTDGRTDGRKRKKAPVDLTAPLQVKIYHFLC